MQRLLTHQIFLFPFLFVVFSPVVLGLPENFLLNRVYFAALLIVKESEC